MSFTYPEISPLRLSHPSCQSKSRFAEILRCALLLAISLSATLSSAQSVKTAEQVYKENCLACHATKFDKAPQVGDQEAWKPFDKEGQHTVTAHGWVGIRNMPPRGGHPELSLEDFTRAAAYMARSAGLDWKDPDDKLIRLIKEEVVKREAELEAKKLKN